MCLIKAHCLGPFHLLDALVGIGSERLVHRLGDEHAHAAARLLADIERPEIQSVIQKFSIPFPAPYPVGNQIIECIFPFLAIRTVGGIFEHKILGVVISLGSFPFVVNEYAVIHEALATEIIILQQVGHNLGCGSRKAVEGRCSDHRHGYSEVLVANHLAAHVDDVVVECGRLIEEQGDNRLVGSAVARHLRRAAENVVGAVLELVGRLDALEEAAVAHDKEELAWQLRKNFG